MFQLIFQLNSLLTQVLEWFSADADNYIRYNHEGMSEFAVTPTAHQQAAVRRQCDTLAAIWLSVLVRSDVTPEHACALRERLREWNSSEHCLKESVSN